KTTIDQIAQKYRQQLARKNLYANLTQQLAEIEQHKSTLLGMYNQELGMSDSNSFFNTQNNSSNQTSISNSNHAGSNIGNDPRGRQITEVEERNGLSDISVTKINIATNNTEGNGEIKLVEVIPDSKLETTNTSDYKNLYLQYRRKAESVLEVESAPLGRRQMIRRYFDSIKPVD
ncbi:MAG: hypothetical protein LBC74_07915, partial [Planctomycetaceae bacterium]|nr:hypothetical protein [Planctomycetaceae bacterium]